MGYEEEDRERRQTEPVTFGVWSGLKNTVSAKRLRPEDLQKAENIDLDDEGMARRRRGWAEVATGDWHSVWEGETRTFAVKDGSVGVVHPDYSFTALQAGAGSKRVSFEQIKDVTYFSSEAVSGKILADDTVQAWGASNDAGTWVSPVVSPTSTLTEVAGRLLKAPPMATEIMEHNGRMWFAHGNMLWASELYLPDYVDSTRTFFQLESKITALGKVEDGFYVGTTRGLFFMSGPLAQLRQRQVLQCGVLAGSMVTADAALVGAEAGASALAVMFTSEEGICVGQPGGVVHNVTQSRVLLPTAISAAAMFRKQDGLNQYISAMESAGTPTSTARVGDYVDAEIVRAVDT